MTVRIVTDGVVVSSRPVIVGSVVRPLARLGTSLRQVGSEIIEGLGTFEEGGFGANYS